MKITKIIYNWIQVEGGEDYDMLEVGSLYLGVEVKTITEHISDYDGDKWFYDVFFVDGTRMRIFNPNIVYYK